MSANDHQPGGSHYKNTAGTQHWDWAELNGMGYLESCATKYMARWRNKNGVEDLKKAVHYTQKALELYLDHGRVNRFNGILALGYTQTSELKAAYDMGPNETLFCHLLLHWCLPQALEQAIRIAERLIEVEEELQVEATRKFVDELTSGKMAERIETERRFDETFGCIEDVIERLGKKADGMENPRGYDPVAELGDAAYDWPREPIPVIFGSNLILLYAALADEAYQVIHDGSNFTELGEELFHDDPDELDPCGCDATIIEGDVTIIEGDVTIVINVDVMAESNRIG